ncbi:hypothetical protein AB7M71_008224 [Bradyrhizobium japonicum]
MAVLRSYVYAFNIGANRSQDIAAFHQVVDLNEAFALLGKLCQSENGLLSRHDFADEQVGPFGASLRGGLWSCRLRRRFAAVAAPPVIPTHLAESGVDKAVVGDLLGIAENLDDPVVKLPDVFDLVPFDFAPEVFSLLLDVLHRVRANCSVLCRALLFQTHGHA